MKKQSTSKQIVIGAFLGVLFTLIAQLKEPTSEPLLSAWGIGLLIGGAVGGVLLYMVLYRFWPSKK